MRTTKCWGEMRTTKMFEDLRYARQGKVQGWADNGEGGDSLDYKREGEGDSLKDNDAMDNIIVPLYHMRRYLAKVRVVHEG